MNENGLSTVDLAAMVPKLKVHSLRLLSTLLSTRNPALLRFSSALSDPLLSMLLDADCIQIDSSLAIPVLSALTGCIKAYPTIVLRGSAHKSLQVVLEQFRTIVGAVTQSRTSVVYSASTHTGMHSSTTEPISEDMTAVESWYGNESDVTEGHNNNSTSGNYNNRLSTLSSSFFLSTIFTDYFTCFSHTIEALLLYSGPMLPTKMREYIEITLTQALLCLQKGVLPLQPPNRHLKRSLSPEVLRQSSTLQSLIIQLCMTDVLTPGADDIVSGNMTLLRSVCQSCLLQSDTSLQAVRTLCVIDAVLFPSAVTLPANHHVHLNRKLTQMNDSGTSAYAVSISESNTNSGNNGDSMTVGVKPSLLSSKKITTATAKAKKNATTTGNNNTGETSLTSTSTTTAAVGVTFKRSSEVINVTSSTGSSSQKGIELVTIQGSQSTATSNSRSKKAKVIDEDGELELPDIQF